MATALLLTGLTASCAYDSDEASASSTYSQSSFTLNVTTSPVGGATRAAYTGGISDAAAADTKSSNEKTVSTLVWGVFSQQTGLEGQKVWAKSWSAASGTNHYTKSDPITGGALTLKENDVVVVAGNLAVSKHTDYEAFTTKDAFLQNKLSILDALTQGTGSIDDTKLPMVGTAKISQTDNDGLQYAANVTMKHMVAKVTLNSLSVNFASTGHPDATFKPLEVFLINVPSEMTLEFDGTDYDPTGLTYTMLYQGEKAYDGTPAEKSFADYLGTGTLAAEENLESGESYSKRVSLYTMPYTMADKTSTTANTRLVIKGEYCADGMDYADDPVSGNNGTKVMYYAVNLKNADNDYNIEPNKHYKVSVTIKGPGADDAYSAIPKYQDMTVNVTCEDWVDDGTEAIVDNGGIKWNIDYTGIQVGDLIYADGTWGSQYSAEWAATHGDPIAIVFSTTTSAYDKSKAQNGIGSFTHGYAMALKRANSGNNVAGWCADASSLRTTAITDVQYDDATAATQWGNLTADLDGLKHCNTAIKYCTDHDPAIDVSNLTAIQVAKAYTPAAPANTSGWYLPSIGQQYLWATALGNAPTTQWSGWRSQYHDFSTSIGTIITDINGKMTAAGLTTGTQFEAFAQQHYLWSSTERTGSYPFDLNFNTDGYLYLHGGGDKSTAGIQVRAVLAF